MGEDDRKFGGFTLDEVKKILKVVDEFSKYKRGGLYETTMWLIGLKDYRGEKIEYPIELEPEEELEMVETFIAICRGRDGELYFKTPEDYVREKFIEEEGVEPDEEVVVESAHNMCQAGECYVPDDICGQDEYIGLIHTHPEYPVSPSCTDVRSEEERKGKVMCISSGDSFACLFLKESGEVPCRVGDFDNDFCIPVKVTKEDVMGNIMEEEYTLCPESFLIGHEMAWVNDVRELIRKGEIAGVCWNIESSPVGISSKDEILCDFGLELLRIKRDSLR